jgi:Tfp pilus assembly protein PilO
MKINKPVWASIMLILTVVFAGIFVWPKFQKLGELQSALARKQVEYRNKSNYYAKIDQVTKTIEEKKDVLDKIGSALPDKFYLSSLTYFFQQAATNANLKLSSASLSEVSNPPAGTRIKNVIFNIHVVGTYDNFKKFLASLENSARLFEINSISFNAASGTNTTQAKQLSNLYDFNLDVLAHTY